MQTIGHARNIGHRICWDAAVRAAGGCGKLRRGVLRGVAAGPLRQDEQAGDDERGNDRGGDRAAQRKAAGIDGLVEEVADGGAQRARQDEGGPEQRHARQAGPVIEHDDHRKRGGEHQRAAFVAEPGRIRHPVAKRRAERLRQRDGRPVEGLGLRRVDGVDGDRAERTVPEAQRGQQADQQHRCATGVSDPQGAVGEVGHGGAECRRGHDGRPVQRRMKFSRGDLQADQPDQGHQEQRGSGQIAPIEGHGDGIAAGLAQGGCGDLDDPEHQGDFGNLAQGGLTQEGLIQGGVADGARV